MIVNTNLNQQDNLVERTMASIRLDKIMPAKTVMVNTRQVNCMPENGLDSGYPGLDNSKTDQEDPEIYKYIYIYGLY